MLRADNRPIVLALDASDEDILSVVRVWCQKLSLEDYEGAVSLLLASAWTADILKTAIETYDGADETNRPHRVTPLETAVYRPGDEPQNTPFPQQSVTRDTSPDGSVYISVWFDLPLDGFWSDLTATFDLDATEEGLGLSIAQVHVM